MKRKKRARQHSALGCAPACRLCCQWRERKSLLPLMMFLNMPACESEASHPQTASTLWASKRPTPEWRRLNLSEQMPRFVSVLWASTRPTNKCIFNAFFFSCSFISVALFFFPRRCRKTNIQKPRRSESWVKHHKATHKANTITNAAGRERLRRKTKRAEIRGSVAPSLHLTFRKVVRSSVLIKPLPLPRLLLEGRGRTGQR